MKKLSIISALVFIALHLSAQTPKEIGFQAITPSLVRAQLEFLASDWMEGRAAGTRGEYLAGDYIASIFKMYGIQPYGDMVAERPAGRSYGSDRTAAPLPARSRSYFQTIPMIEYTPGEEQLFSVINKTSGGEVSVDFQNNTDFSVRTGNVGTSGVAEVVFAGYGYTNEKSGYDDYAKVDVAGKVVVILPGFPGHKDEKSAAFGKFRPEGRYGAYAVERNKIARAEKLGAVAIVQLRPGENPSAGWSANQIYPVRGTFYESDAPITSGAARMALQEDALTGQVPTFTVSGRAAQMMLGGTGIDINRFENAVQETLQPASVMLIGKLVKFKTTVSSRIVNVRNVLGYIEGESKNEVIVVGAHYDHMGKVDGWIWNGADDNASGTVGVMTIARAFAATGKKPEKSVVFAAWTGEEKGLLGSKYFVKNVPGGDKVILNLNYDMIARNEPDDTKGIKADMVYTEAWKEIRDVTARNLKDFNIGLNLSYSPAALPGGGSDHAPFAAAGIPIFYFMAAMHPDYHLPSDELDKVNWSKMTDIIRIGFLNTWDFANRRDNPLQQGGSEEPGRAVSAP